MCARAREQAANFFIFTLYVFGGGALTNLVNVAGKVREKKMEIVECRQALGEET